MKVFSLFLGLTFCANVFAANREYAITIDKVEASGESDADCLTQLQAKCDYKKSNLEYYLNFGLKKDRTLKIDLKDIKYKRVTEIHLCSAQCAIVDPKADF